MPITYQTEEIKIDIVGQKINLQQVTNVDEVFDDLISKDSCDEMVKDEQIPYWTEIWPSSIGLCMHLNTISEEINGSRVLELGCGLGLPSIYAGFLNPKSVKATDYLEDALTFCKSNWLLNHSSNIFETARFDWRSPNLIMKSYDVLLAADIVYEDRMVTSVFDFLVKNLVSVQVFILSDPDRKTCSALLEKLQGSGDFFISEFNYDVVWREVKTSIRVFEIRAT